MGTRLIAWTLATLTLVSSGCIGHAPAGGSSAAAPPAPDLPAPNTASTTWQLAPLAPLGANCAVSEETSRRAAQLYSQTSAAVHELITCGQLQFKVASSLMVAIAKSNPEFITPDLLDDLGADPSDQFEHAANGDWRISLVDGGPDSKFTVRFFDPASGNVITEDLFRLKSYFSDVKVTHDMTADQMVASPGKAATYTFKWTKLGPLAPLLNDGKPLPNPIVLQLSAMDLLALQTLTLPASKLGVFGSLLDLRCWSRTVFIRAEDGVSLGFQVEAPQQTLGTIASKHAVNFGALGLRAIDGQLELRADQQQLQYADPKGLAGFMNLKIAASKLNLRVHADFGTGQSYEDATWSCP